ncbi:MAG: DoxX family protein [Patescibacteria group bacterium]|nr:DoxX family protein [Patescibacteria group bacterium]
MRRNAKIAVFLLRITTGWMFFYAGIVKIMNPAWSAVGYLQSAKTFPGFYNALASPALLPFTNFINEWGLTLIGASLILGIGVRWSGILGALMMVLYYLPILEFPYPNAHSYIVDEHIIYAAALLLLSALRAGHMWGLERAFSRIPLLGRISQ